MSERDAVTDLDICEDFKKRTFIPEHMTKPFVLMVEYWIKRAQELEDENKSVKNWNACEEEDHEKLLAENAGLRAELDAAVRDLEELAGCKACLYVEACNPYNCKHAQESNFGGIGSNNWQWRGLEVPADGT